jgi:hypothetical protein
MILSRDWSIGEQIDHFRYSLLRVTVMRLVPAVLQFDEADPLLVAGSAPARGTG